MVAHALENDNPIAGGLDDLVKNLEPINIAQAKRRKLILNQTFARLLQRLLHLPNAHCTGPALKQTLLDKRLSEEMRLAAPTTAPRALISRRLQQRLENLGSVNYQISGHRHR